MHQMKTQNQRKRQVNIYLYGGKVESAGYKAWQAWSQDDVENKCVDVNGQGEVFVVDREEKRILATHVDEFLQGADEWKR
jgi:hypothetical protein